MSGEGTVLFVQETNPVPGGGTIQYWTKPHFVCADGVDIWADSAVTYSAQSMSHLMGAVRYVDRTRELLADEARYFSDLGRLQAQGHVFVRDNTDGSVVENGDLVYLRRTDSRDEESVTVTIGADGLRPRATVLPTSRPDSSAATAEAPMPYTVVADRIVLRGGSGFSAVGEVEIERDSLLAFADSAEYDGTADRLILEGSARIEGAAYDLEGRRITMATAEAQTNEVRAIRDAILIGKDLEVTASLIIVELTDGELQRLVAIPLPEDTLIALDSMGPARPVAISEEFEFTADSLEVLAPANVVERIFGAGMARSVSRAQDSLNVETLPEIARTDWIDGDTIVMTFRRVAIDSTLTGAPTDSAESRYEVERIVARVAARSLYRTAASDSTWRAGVDRPTVDYVVGDEITILLSGGAVVAMEVTGQTQGIQGIHLEPLRTLVVADSLTDSTAVPADTLRVRSRPTTGHSGGEVPPPEPTPVRSAQPWRRP